MKKYKAIICDDDQIILAGLQNLIPWDEIGIELCACCSNGREAKDFFDQYLPDVIVSDIKMPFMSGIELTQYVKQQRPETKVIIISGYDDFIYAQAAVKAGAIDYILKPIDEKNIIEQLRRAVDECKKDEAQRIIAKEHQTLWEEKMLHGLIFEDSKTYIRKYGIENYENSENGFHSIMLLRLSPLSTLTSENQGNERDKAIQQFDNCVREITGVRVGTFEQRPGFAGIYIVAQSHAEHESIRNEAIDSIKRSFEKEGHSYRVIFACSSIKKQLSQIKQAYHEAQLVMKEHFTNPVNDILIYNEASVKDLGEATKYLVSALTEIDFVSIIKQGDKKQIDQQLNLLRDTMLSIGGNSDVFMKMMVANLYARLLKESKQLGLEQKGFPANPIEEYQKAAECMNVDEGIYELRKNMYAIIDFLEQNRSSRNSKLVAKALEFIGKNYTTHEFSIDDVAEFVHISPSYFSVIFKSEQGVAFTDYLIQLRMEQAINLMRNTDMPIYEISYAVGYDTAAYFSSAFKKYACVSPSAYKKGIV